MDAWSYKKLHKVVIVPFCVVVCTHGLKCRRKPGELGARSKKSENLPWKKIIRDLVTGLCYFVCNGALNLYKEFCVASEYLGTCLGSNVFQNEMVALK